MKEREEGGKGEGGRKGGRKGRRESGRVGEWEGGREGGKWTASRREAIRSCGFCNM